MNLGAITHRSAFSDCYALNKDEMVLNIRTGKDVTAVNLICEDPFAYGIAGDHRWYGKTVPMTAETELKHNRIWTATVVPEYKRLQYYFEVYCGEEKLLMFEDDFYTEEDADRQGRIKQYFKFPWLNCSDVITIPQWVESTVWYQIMPDRFCRGDMDAKRMKLKDWDADRKPGFGDFYGGDLRGIINKLPYLHELGITGLYMIPVFASNSNHKYNTIDYTMIDPDFGTGEDMRELVEKAHALGIRVMLDAVFNHSGTGFFAWQDVWEKGEDSAFFDWFCINQRPFTRKRGSLRDGRFYGFAFIDEMPKLNTNNPEVVDYFTGICRGWIAQWGIDGIRFDVGNEVSHSFLKKLNAELKGVNPEIFLLGEIWHDSVQWLQGDEYDSVMNYPFMESLHNFWVDNGSDSRDFMYAMNRCYSLYPRQVNRILFNFLDTHDTMRLFTRCQDADAAWQQLAVLMTMPGTACIYYGTEIALEGGHDPDCRRPMPWGRIESGECDPELCQMKQLIALRKQHQIRDTKILWHHDPQNPRLVCYDRPGADGSAVRVYLNSQAHTVTVPDNKVLFSRGYRKGDLAPGGVVIMEI